jgi:hypothetical protein
MTMHTEKKKEEPINNDNDSNNHRLTVRSLDWSAPETYGTERFDILLGSDLVYHKDIVPALAQVVEALLTKDGQFWHVASQARASLVEFKHAMAMRGFSCVIEIVPDEFKANPLVVIDDRGEAGDAAVASSSSSSSSKDLFDIHFNEMNDVYCIYRFMKAP